MFRQLIAWLNSRFPVQLTVSVQEMKEIREELGQYNLAVQAVTQLNERLVSLEAQVRKLNDMNGFVTTNKGSYKLER